MEKIIVIQICAPVRIPPGYPMSGRVFEDFIVKGYNGGRKDFGAVSHSASLAAAWAVDFLTST